MLRLYHRKITPRKYVHLFVQSAVCRGALLPWTAGQSPTQGAEDSEEEAGPGRQGVALVSDLWGGHVALKGCKDAWATCAINLMLGSDLSREIGVS